MLWNLYLRRGTVFVPTIAQTQAGFYLDVDPMEVISAQDTRSLESAIVRTISKGNPQIPTPEQKLFPKSTLLEYAKVKSWSQFERESDCWSVEKNSDGFQVKPQRRRSDRGWEDDPEKIEFLPPDTAIERIASRLVTLIQIRASEK